MRRCNHDEIRLIVQICKELDQTELTRGKLTKKLEDHFGERAARAVRLVEEGAVKRCLFKPSGRVIWEVKGRKGTYQVMPKTNFCSCDDYYFRVMSSSKQLCYHIIAQRIAAALGRFKNVEYADEDYGKITHKWKKSIRQQVY
jgi:predicted nucleic acid-binding Zn finger protein